MLIKNLAESSKNKTYIAIPHPLHCIHYVCEGFLGFCFFILFTLNCLIPI